MKLGGKHDELLKKLVLLFFTINRDRFQNIHGYARDDVHHFIQLVESCYAANQVQSSCVAELIF